METKLAGFIGPAYTLDSLNAESQRCVDLYPEMRETPTKKDNQVAYLRSTPGLLELTTVGDGPIRLVHRDSIGRMLIVSGNGIFRISKSAQWSFYFLHGTLVTPEVVQASGIDTGTDVLTSVAHGMVTGTKVFVSSTTTLPGGLSASPSDYYVIKIDADTFKLADTYAAAIADSAVNITSVGTGTMTLTNQPFGADLASYVYPKGCLYSNINFTDNTFYYYKTDPEDEFNPITHGLITGDPVEVNTQGTPLLPELAYETTYYAIATTATTFKLATSLVNAQAGTAIDISEISGTWKSEPIKVEQASSATDATLDTSSGPIRAASMTVTGDGEDSSTMFTDGTKNYILSDSSSVLATYSGEMAFYAMGETGSDLTFPAGPISSHIAWIDGYFILNQVNSNKFWTSGLASFNIDALSYASSEGDPDLVVGLINNNRDLWIFNEQSTEIYVNSGNSNFPFDRVQGGFLEVGCLAGYSIARINGTIFWLGAKREGQGAVYMGQGLQHKRISTHAIEQAIAGYADPSSATAYTYEDRGHAFYVLNFAEASWVYDLSTGLWHERAFTTSGVLGRQLPETHAFDVTTGLHIVGDYASNEVYQYDEDTYTHDGEYITRLRTCPYVISGLKRLVCSFLQIDMETGVGLASGQGSDPQVMLDWSDDGGHTWSDEAWTSAGGQIGGIGEYSKRVIFRRLGMFRQRIFRVKVTDPVKVTFLDAILDIVKMRS